MVTDIIALCLLLFLIGRGFSRGFMQSLAGPLAFLIATAAALYYYGISKNLILSLAIGLIAPFILHWAFMLILRSFEQTSGGQILSGYFSRLMGAAVTVAWGAALVLPVIFILGIIPPINPQMTAVHKDVTGSAAFAGARRLAGCFTASATPAQTLANDAQMQALIKDPAIVKAVEEKNFAALMSNPKITAMAQDPAFVKKVLTAYSSGTMVQPPPQAQQPPEAQQSPDQDLSK